jgi:hypothetical protein
VATKAKRLHEIFGDNTCIILVFREQLSLLRSLYTEMVKGGYPGTFKKFLEYTYLFQDRNWCLEFCFDRVIHVYANLFGSENICAVPFELLKSAEAEFKRRICDAIGIVSVNTPMRELNKQVPTLVYYEMMRRFNERCPHEFGSAFYQPFSVMRMSSYFHNELGVAVPQDYLASDFLRMPLTKGAMQLAKNSHVPEIDLRFPPALKERLIKIYSPSNVALSEAIGVNLSQYGYQMQ